MRKLKPHNPIQRLKANAICLFELFAACSVWAGDIPIASPNTIAKPGWLAELSLGIKGSYDDNVYLAGANPRFLPPSYSLPSGSAPALKDRSAFVTTVSPRAVIDFAPVLGVQNLNLVSLGYCPEFASYHDARSESYTAQRFNVGIKGKGDQFTVAVDNGFTYVDGNAIAPTYPGALLNALGIVAARERRNQIQDRANLLCRYDQGRWFARAVGSLCYYEMMTAQVNVSGYQNYPDRYDAYGGGDIGLEIHQSLAATVGYRYGHQYQQQFDFSPYSSSSDYQRLLFGLEGKPFSWLELKLQGGPDLRDYAPNTATHITPVADKHPVKYYGEATIAATLSPKDALAFKYKQFQWVSSLGKVPYFDSTYDLSYRRKLTDGLSADLGARVLDADYNSGNLPNCRRNDLQYSVVVGLTWNVSAHVAGTLAYSLDLGRNAQDGIVDPQTREYSRDLASMGVTWKF